MAMNGEQKSVPHDLDEKKSHPNSDHVKTKCCTRTKKKGDRGFIEGCLFALCCCWLCDACFDVTVVAG
ncbi:hypothetical protein CsatB_018782 [Cannabis sativa]|uniref:Cysteine-rich transmembrane domain-containing protein n=1 Tax=Cannabis sativa TaxID=3483 RepID=A0A7J6DNZ5_CANSA|nr:hypothetical protein G4B88_011093 [Cannabis sativa]